jgi:hypothetical protein
MLSMKKSFFWANLGLVWALCTGCPYESAVPIDAPSVAIDPQLLGKWRTDPEAQDLLEVTRADAFTYRVTEVATKADSTTERKHYLGHLSLVDGVKFVNLQAVASNPQPADSTTYMLFKLELRGKDRFVLSPVSEYVREQFKTSAELKAFIKKHLRLSFFYETEMVYERW